MSTAKWAQDHRRVFLSVKINGAAAAANQEFSVTPEGALRLAAANQVFEVALFDTVEPDHPETAVTWKPNSAELVLRKGGRGYWKGLLAGNKKDRAISVDWDKWVDEDECDDDPEEECHPCDGPPVSAYEPSAVAAEEDSPVDGDGPERFQRLNPNEKMLLLAHTWNKCDEDQRAAAMLHLKSILDDGSPTQELSSADLKGSGILGERDLQLFPPDVSLPHVDAWLEVFGGLDSDGKVGYFDKMWNWCNDDEKKLVMAGLSR
eukprot:TRINITY_DN5746_c0_g1_i4.p1 TRINITY_DN5746_c0_g1~~TRINITY_DN5746_c0_g1_i4.p1  ORF type:complete len:262 (+),score=72.13 TRINITY_DN5746_c0_g1_i4:173-958(+)